MSLPRSPSTGSPAATRDPWSGLLMIDKPTGVTSHDVVDRVRRRLRTRAVGHLGTLDPVASGLLLIAVGAATRCAAVWQGGEKTYEAGVRFGIVTSTQDVTGDTLERHETLPDEAAVREAARALVGEIDQVPPMVSALHVGGQRLYRLARRGIEVERAPRRVVVSEWEWLGFSLPSARFRVRCSSGTYVRTLAHDLGRSLGVGGALESLRRLRSEPFGLERSVPMRDLATLEPEEIRARAGLDLEDALGVLPSVGLDAAAAEAIGFGRTVTTTAEAVRPPRIGVAPRAPIEGGPRSVAIFGPDERVLALGELGRDVTPERGLRVRPHAVFPWAVREGRS